ncbi:hypothetical protein Avbf_13083 [Armadillidium vulgare]|nr:hypothetical protein Avbf_13083 [Armadillidium vulgare]
MRYALFKHDVCDYRSSLGSITSFKGKEAIERKDSMISSNTKQQKRYSSLSSLHSQDSGSSSVASSSIEPGGLKTLNESEKNSVMRILLITKTRERKIGKEEKEKGLKVIVPGKIKDNPPLKPEQRQI